MGQPELCDVLLQHDGNARLRVHAPALFLVADGRSRTTCALNSEVK